MSGSPSKSDWTADLREINYDRYLASLYLPPNIRRDVTLIELWDAEIQAIPKRVSEPTAGEIRLQWWREALGGAREGEAAGHPLASALLATIKKHELPINAFEQALDARVFDLYHDPMPDLPTLEGYCGETSALLYQLKLQVLLGREVSNHAELCGYAGMVSGLSDILINIPVHHRNKRVYVPKTLIEAAGLTPQAWLASNDNSKHLVVLQHLISLASDYLQKIQAQLTEQDPSIFPIFLPLRLDRENLLQVDRAGLDMFAKPVAGFPLKKHWILWRAMRNRRI